MSQKNRLTRDDLPNLEEGNSIELTTNKENHTATVTEVSDNGSSTAFTLNINEGNTESKMYADVRCVELIVNNESQFVEEVNIFN